MAEFVFAPGEVRFHGAKRPAHRRRDLRVGEALLIEKMQGGAFVRIEQRERGGEISVKCDGARGRRRQVFCRVRRERHRDRVGLAPPGVAKMIVGDAAQPRREPGIGAVVGETAIGLEESFLGQVIGERVIAAREMTEKISHGGLVSLDQFAEGRAIIVKDDTGDEFWVGRTHARSEGWRLGESGALSVFVSASSAKRRFTAPMKVGIAAYILPGAGNAR